MEGRSLLTLLTSNETKTFSRTVVKNTRLHIVNNLCGYRNYCGPLSSNNNSVFVTKTEETFFVLLRTRLFSVQVLYENSQIYPPFGVSLPRITPFSTPYFNMNKEPY